MTTGSDEIGQISAVMDIYVKGAGERHCDSFRQIFHDMATICGYVGPDLFAGPIEQFYAWHEQNGPATSLSADTPIIDVEGSAASARIELHDWTGHRFTDFFTLVRVDGDWKIISKVFYLHDD